MTTARRGRRSPPTRRPRTSRRVWVNKYVSSNLTVDTIALIDLLTPAEEFMKFDCTVLGIVIPWLSYSFDGAAVNEIREIAVAIMAGNELLDAADVQVIRTSNVGPPWMWSKGTSALFAATAQTVTMDLISGQVDVRIKAKRRFTENNETLWLLAENAAAAGDANLVIKGLVRTLLLVP